MDMKQNLQLYSLTNKYTELTHFAPAPLWILHHQALHLPTCFLTFSRSNTYRTIRYPMAITSNTSRFTHFAFPEDEMSYEPRTAWTPGILLISPTAKDVPTYSFSTKPCKFLYQVIYITLITCQNQHNRSLLPALCTCETK